MLIGMGDNKARRLCTSLVRSVATNGAFQMADEAGRGEGWKARHYHCG